MLSKKVVTKQQVIYYICIFYQFVLSIMFIIAELLHISCKYMARRLMCLELPATFLNCVLTHLYWGGVGVIIYYSSQT